MSRFLILFTTLLCLTSPIRAEDKMVVDMSKLTCAELNRLGFQDFAGITMWLSGYYNASVRNTVIDLDRFALAAKTVKDFCKNNTRATVVSAAERALVVCDAGGDRRSLAEQWPRCRPAADTSNNEWSCAAWYGLDSASATRLLK